MKTLCQGLCLLALASLPGNTLGEARDGLVVGSKKFTESVILGEMARMAIAAAGQGATHRAELGGSRVLFNALEAGEIDVYPEYTGTLMHELLAGEAPTDLVAIREALARRGLAMLDPLGFDNTYAIGMTERRAAQLNISTVSDLIEHPGLVLGLSHEFMDRADGWPGLMRRYGLRQAKVRGLDHDLAYRALAAGRIDAMDIYTTDAEITHYRLRALVDDLAYFREYRAVLLYRSELQRTAPAALAQLRQLSGRIDQAAMSAMNSRVKLSGEPEATVAGDFLADNLSLEIRNDLPSVAHQLLGRTLEHLSLVAWSLSAAITVG